MTVEQVELTTLREWSKITDGGPGSKLLLFSFFFYYYRLLSNLEEHETSVSKESVYNSYETYCRMHQILPATRDIIGKIMQKIFPKVILVHSGSGGKFNCMKWKVDDTPKIQDNISVNIPDHCLATQEGNFIRIEVDNAYHKVMLNHDIENSVWTVDVNEKPLSTIELGMCSQCDFNQQNLDTWLSFIDTLKFCQGVNIDADGTCRSTHATSCMMVVSMSSKGDACRLCITLWVPWNRQKVSNKANEPPTKVKVSVATQTFCLM
jgi:hypothetical protein